MYYCDIKSCKLCDQEKLEKLKKCWFYIKQGKKSIITQWNPGHLLNILHQN